MSYLVLKLYSVSKSCLYSGQKFHKILKFQVSGHRSVGDEVAKPNRGQELLLNGASGWLANE